jgi:hypothetical protein
MLKRKALFDDHPTATRFGARGFLTGWSRAGAHLFDVMTLRSYPSLSPVRSATTRSLGAKFYRGENEKATLYVLQKQ